MPRLDIHLVNLGHFASRSRARDAIVRGTVTVDGKVATKPGLQVTDTMAVEVKDPAAQYVSRAAIKLVTALDHFSFDPEGRTALDIGASTGGFTQVLLERDARLVFAVDVGSGQLDSRLQNDPRVTNLEQVNARRLDISPSGQLGTAAISAVVSDVSFISLRLALPPALERAEPAAFAALLVKPQFEVGRRNIGKGGMVADDTVAERAADSLAQWLDQQPGWRSVGLTASPIHGADGNREFLLGGIKDRV